MKQLLSEKELFLPLPDLGLSISTDPRFDEIDSFGGLCLSSWWRRDDGDVDDNVDDEESLLLSFSLSLSLSFLLLLLSRFELELEW